MNRYQSRTEPRQKRRSESDRVHESNAGLVLYRVESKTIALRADPAVRHQCAHDGPRGMICRVGQNRYSLGSSRICCSYRHSLRVLEAAQVRSLQRHLVGSAPHFLRNSCASAGYEQRVYCSSRSCVFEFAGLEQICMTAER